VTPNPPQAQGFFEFVLEFPVNRKSFRNFCESFGVYAHRQQTVNPICLCCQIFKLRRRLSARTLPGVAHFKKEIAGKEKRA
jgi:hypothetical protein